jgi:hypothetical protein
MPLPGASVHSSKRHTPAWPRIEPWVLALGSRCLFDHGAGQILMDPRPLVNYAESQSIRNGAGESSAYVVEAAARPLAEAVAKYIISVPLTLVYWSAFPIN